MPMIFRNKKLEQLLTIVCKDYNVTEEQLRGAVRNKQVVEARWILWYMLRNYGALSYTQIGNMFNKDHSSIISGVKKLNDNTIKHYTKIFNDLSVEETPDSHDLLQHSQTSAVLTHLKSMDQSLAKLTDRVAVDETPYLLHIDRDTYNLLVELKNLLYHLFAQPSESPNYAYDQQYTDQHQNSKDLLSSDREDLNIENDLGNHGVRPRKDNIH